ncbi:MAG TPA: SIMPL domain-containing protein [Actinomycetes bacterium]|nr:SIMPL domain-containing protein [Actinomycetes bacterium]
MTLTRTGRRVLLGAALVIALVVAYVLGTSRTSGTAYATGPAALATPSASDRSDLVTVSATGTATGTPDTLRTSFSVQVTAASVGGAVDGANTDMAKVQASLRAHGVAAKDLQTSDVSLYSEQVRLVAHGPLVRRYVMSESVTAVLRSIAKASDTIGAAVKAGGSAVSLDDVSLDLGDDSSLVTAARTNAFDAAKTKADQYAHLAGRSLGPVVTITETVGSEPRPVYDGTFPAASAAASATSLPIATGSQDVTVTVTVAFTLQ